MNIFHRYLLRDKQGYLRCSYLTDWRGIKSAIGEMRGIGHPPQPRLSKILPAAEALFFNEAWFIDALKEKVAHHPQNSMEGPLAGEKLFTKPLVGFVSGADPLFQEFKRIIGPHHFTPAEIMAWQAKNNGVPPPRAEDISVVAFILPLTEKVKNENANSREWPGELWAQARLLGEIFSQIMVREVVALLMSRGILAVAPDATPLFNKKRYPQVGWASPWSHRHIAYAAGLGTFGLNDFLITEKGAAHRCGSFVVNLKLNSDRARPKDIHAYCLQYQGHACLRCAARCPAKAISPQGHDKEACSRRVAKSILYCNRRYHIFIYGCGLCATGVPCASGIPKAG